jgi:haloalkane dehalogenase
VVFDTQFDWLNLVQYPFRTREFHALDGWMSYVDEGRGRPIVFVHGAPTWSYVFRHLIRHLCPWHRCIAPDHLGFGLSEKPERLDYRLETQAQRFEALMDYLNLRDVTLVVHDAGGPIGLQWAIRNPARVREIVCFNTWMWSLRNNHNAYKLARLVGNPLNRIYYRLLNASPGFIMPALFADRHQIPKPTQRQYLEPFRPFSDRAGLYGMIEGLQTSTAWFESLWAQREAIAHKRALLLWGTKDPIHGPDSRDRLAKVFDQCTVVDFPSVGRFVPEEAPRLAAEEIRWFLINSPSFTPFER